MAVTVKFSIVHLNKACILKRIFLRAAITLAACIVLPLSSQLIFAAEGDGGAEQLRQFVRISKTAEGDFVQQQLRSPKGDEPKDKGLKVIRQTSGHFIFQRPGHFVWDTQKPYEQKLIADGKQLILWDKDLNQATFRPAGQALASTPAASLFGEGALDENFDLVNGEDHLGMKWVYLKPKVNVGSKRADEMPYTKISVGMANGLPKALELVDGLGSVVLVTLDHIELNVTLPASRFTFVPPAGAEVLHLH